MDVQYGNTPIDCPGILLHMSNCATVDSVFPITNSPNNALVSQLSYIVAENKTYNYVLSSRDFC